MKKKRFFRGFEKSGMMKLLLVMKLTTFLLFLSVMAIASGSYSQNTRFDLNVRNASIVKVLEEIENKTEYGFLFKTDQLDLEERYNLDIKGARVENVLDEILDKDIYAYKIMDRIIVISKLGSEIIMAGDQNTGKVSGKITDTRNQPLPGVTVVIKGTSKGTVTDENGNFSLANIPDNATLIFSFVGMVSQEIQVKGQSQINVTMQADFIGIEEVVAVGYGTMKKSDVTGSVSSVTPEKLVDRPVLNVGQALQNKVAGVQVIRQAAGDPGGRPQIRIRGTNSINTNSEPLFVVDGIVGVLNALQNLDPQDIASMDILKDASATAIYGTRGANGVIIITTKRGVAGDMKVNYDGSVSLGFKTRHNYAVNADQFMSLCKNPFSEHVLLKIGICKWF